ncbi:competence type IV pilus minor pilin ComGF [Oceanobacillus sp. CAU 1775]
MHLLFNKNGFTFITTLFMISILALTLPFLSYSLQAVGKSSNYDELAIHEFYRFLRNELIESTSINIAGNNLYLTQELDDEGEVNVAVISQYDSLIRRQVNNVGHEVLLFDISSVTFNEHPYGLNIVIVSKDGKAYEKTFAFYN